jgi:hypothetical protein
MHTKSFCNTNVSIHARHGCVVVRLNVFLRTSFNPLAHAAPCRPTPCASDSMILRPICRLCVRRLLPDVLRPHCAHRYLSCAHCTSPCLVLLCQLPPPPPNRTPTHPHTHQPPGRSVSAPRYKQRLVDSGIAVLIVAPYSDDDWDAFDSVWTTGLDKPFFNTLFTAFSGGSTGPLGALSRDKVFVQGYVSPLP